MPSVAVDELWHEFIIFTRDYHSFCESVFGEYLHHDPYGKFDLRSSEDDGLKNTLLVLNKMKPYRIYNTFDIQVLNKNVPHFYLLFCIDYLIKNTSYEDAVRESNKDIQNLIKY